MRMLRILLSRINKMWLLMGLAVILGLVATWVTTRYLKTREARIQAEAMKRAAGGETVAVVVPQRNLPKGTVVDGSVMAARDVLADTVYDETIRADQFGSVQGSRLLRAVEKGRPLRQSDLDLKAKDFAGTLPEGRRAITIEIDEINSIAQMVRVGNRIDLMLIVPDESTGGQRVISLIQKVKVIATGQITRTVAGEGGQPVAQRYSNVTFDVSPEEASRILLGQQVGKIRASLRNDEDDVVAPLARMNTQIIMQGYPTSPFDSASIEYILGGKGGGIGAPQTVNLNMPGLPAGASAGAAAERSVPAGSIAGPGQQQITVPGVGSFSYPSPPGGATSSAATR